MYKPLPIYYLAGSAEASSEISQSSVKVSGSVLPEKTSQSQSNIPVGSDVDDFNLGLDVKVGPLKVKATVNPISGGVMGAKAVNAYSKQALGQAPPTPVFMLLHKFFGIGNKK